MLVYAAVISIPFLLIRVMWSVIDAFVPNSKIFNWIDPDVLIRELAYIG